MFKPYCNHFIASFSLEFFAFLDKFFPCIDRGIDHSGNHCTRDPKAVTIEFWETHPDAEQPLRAWYLEAKRVNWTSPTDIKATYRSASILSNNRVVFNIKGNNYRLVVVVEYTQENMFIRFVGTHAEYDRIDAARI